jgi:hypothetical protein
MKPRYLLWHPSLAHGNPNSQIHSVAQIQHWSYRIVTPPMCPAMLERLGQNAIPALRTDTGGAIRIFTNGKKLRVSCFVACTGIDAQINSVKPRAPDNQQASQQQ